MSIERGVLSILFGIGLFITPGCDDGEDGSGDEVGDGDGDGDGDGVVDPSGDGDGDSGGDKGGDFGGDGDEGDDGELMGCALHETEAACSAEFGCVAVIGKAVVEDGDGGWCTLAEQFIGCADSTVLCPGLSKTLCDEDGYWQTTGCVPDNLEACEAPGEITGDC